jgi:hypothetical protein
MLKSLLIYSLIDLNILYSEIMLFTEQRKIINKVKQNRYEIYNKIHFVIFVLAVTKYELYNKSN